MIIIYKDIYLGRMVLASNNKPCGLERRTGSLRTKSLQDGIENGFGLRAVIANAQTGHRNVRWSVTAKALERMSACECNEHKIG